MIDTPHITGLVLAGGRGTRMGGVDKGLQPFRGVPLAQHALERLAPQVGALMLNANRHLDLYTALGAPWGAPVWPDGLADYAGPLAGFLTGLEHCGTPWLLTVPCDTPLFPHHLAARLAAAAARDGSDMAMAMAPQDDGAGGVRMRPQPVFSLLRVSLQWLIREGRGRPSAAAHRRLLRAKARNGPGREPRAVATATTS